MIDTIVLTHEHFDHIAATACFTGRKMVAAHRLAATKIVNQDEFAILSGSFGETAEEFGIDLMLDERVVIDTGAHVLRAIHTPGHTSGSISLLEANHGLLVSGDLILAGGNLGGVFASGNLSDTIHSLQTLAACRASRLPQESPHF